MADGRAAMARAWFMKSLVRKLRVEGSLTNPAPRGAVPFDLGHSNTALERLDGIAVLESRRMAPRETVPHIILASASPRRRELLALTPWRADVRPAQADERPLAGEDGAGVAQRLSRVKAHSVAEQAPAGSLVLAADTVVVLDGVILGKPADAGEARVMLETLRGREHEVITGLALLVAGDSWEANDACRTLVPMRDYTESEAEAYVRSGAALDKAGAYGIQDRGFEPVDTDRMSGCFANVMGLPLCHLVRLMRRRGISAAADVPTACQAHTHYTCSLYPQIVGKDA
jgi:MAF protein